jgi:hypothetical protein
MVEIRGRILVRGEVVLHRAQPRCLRAQAETSHIACGHKRSLIILERITGSRSETRTDRVTVMTRVGSREVG